MTRRNISEVIQYIWRRSLAAKYTGWFVAVVGITAGMIELIDLNPCPVRIVLAMLLGIGGLLLVLWFFQEDKETRRFWNLLLLLICWIPTTVYFSSVATKTCKNECPTVDLHANPKTLLPGEVANLLVTASDPENDEVTFEWEATAPGLFREGPSYTTTQNEYTAPLIAPPPQRVEITVWADDHHCGRKVPAVIFLNIQLRTSTPTATPTFTFSSTPTVSSTPSATPSATLTLLPTMKIVTPTLTSPTTRAPMPLSTPSQTPTLTPSPDSEELPPPGDSSPAPIEATPTPEEASRTPPPP